MADLFLFAALLGLWRGAPRAAEVPLASSLPIRRIIMMTATPPAGPLIPFIGDDTAHVAYELYLTNFSKRPTRIIGLRVHGLSGAFDTTIEGDALKAAFLNIGSNSADPVLARGATGIIFVFLNFGSRRPPAKLDESIIAEPDGDPGDAQIIKLSALEVRTLAAAPTIDAPLAGDRWQAGNGPSNTSAHRRAVLGLDGKAWLSQRYAIDWIKLGDDGNSFSGDEHRNQSYHAYDTPIIAVADGRVVTVVDGVPENVPHTEKRAVELTLTNLPGNHIIEDIGGGCFVGYAHMRPGTISVKAGDLIHRGQVLGRLGNSGNSSEPHLHLQICDGPSFIACNGVPMQFRELMLTRYTIEKKGEIATKLVIEGAPISAAGQEPMEDELATFPSK